MSTSVGVIGMGLMGAAIARRLVDLGHEVTVWNRTPEKCAALAAAGARVASTSRDLIAGADVVVTVTSTHATLEPIFSEASAELAGTDVVNLVTGSPLQIRSIAALATGGGANFLSGTIQAYPSNIGQAEAAIICGGDGAVWERRQALISSLAGASFYTGEDPGRPNVLDSAVTGCFLFGAMGACLEAASYAQKEGVTVAEFRDMARQSVRKLSMQIDALLGAVEASDFSTTDATLETFAGSLELFRSAFADVGASDHLLHANLQRMRVAIGNGAGANGFAALYQH